MAVWRRRAQHGFAWRLYPGPVYLITQPPFVYQTYHALGLRWRDVASIYLKPSLLAAVSVTAGLAAAMLPALQVSPLARVLMIAAVAAGLYLTMVRYRPAVWFEIAGRLQAATRRV